MDSDSLLALLERDRNEAFQCGLVIAALVAGLGFVACFFI